MKLDRSINADGRGKYALVNMREIDRIGGANAKNPDIAAALRILEINGLIEYGGIKSENEFFAIKLKDQYAGVALVAYSEAALLDDPEYATEIAEMAERSGPKSQWCKKPD